MEQQIRLSGNLQPLYRRYIQIMATSYRYVLDYSTHVETQ